MAADVDIKRMYGAITGSAPTYEDVTSGTAQMGTSDETSPSTIPVPTAGSNYSYWVHTMLYAACAPDNSITNLKWFTDGANSFGTGTNCIVSTASAYAQAVGTAGSSGALMDTACHAGLSGPDDDGSASDAFGWVTGSRLSVAGSIDGSTGCVGDEFVVYQLRVDTTAGAGNTGEETWTWAYDES